MKKCLVVVITFFSFCWSLYAQAPEDFFNRAYVYVQRGYMDEAIREYGQALKCNPDAEMSTRIFYNMGLIYQRVEKPELAIEAFKKAIQIKPKLFTPRYNLANALYEVKRFKEAAEQYEQALQIDPDYSNKMALYYRIAESYSNAGNHDKTIEWAGEIVKEKPNDAAIWQILADSYFAKKSYKEVEQCLNKLENLGYPQKDFFLKLQEARNADK